MIDGAEKNVAVSKIFDNNDFGYSKITVERPLRDEKGTIILAEKGKLKGKKLETRLASLETWEKELVELEGKLPR